MDKNEKLNKLVISYRGTRCDIIFGEIYSIVSAEWKGLSSVARSIRSDEHETLAIYEDTLLRCIEVYDGRGNFTNLLKRSIWRARRDVYRKNGNRMKNELYQFETDAGKLFDIKDESANIEIGEIKEADRLALIDSLLKDADELTIGVVKTFLEHPKPTPTAIGKSLGLHHSTVIRKLERLAGKFDSKQYGSHRDYLVAL